MLLLFSLSIGALGLYTVSAAALEDATGTFPLIISFVAAYLFLHLIIRFVLPQADPLLLPLAALLNGMGLTLIYRTKPHLVQLQLYWLVLGVLLAAATVILWGHIRKIENYKYLTALAGVALLLAPAIAGREVGGAKLWLSWGNLSLQPAEPAKLLIVIFLAAYLKEKRELLSLSTYRLGDLSLPEPKHLAPLLTMWLLSLLVLILEKDIGSSFLFLTIFLVMIYVATSRLVYVDLGAGLFLFGAIMCYYAFAHVRLRVGAWINPWPALGSSGYQIAQSLFAFASGGLSGAGLGQGFPTRIPAVHTDFIFAALGEELGYAGAVAVLLAYLLFIQRGVTISLRASGEFEKLLGFGLSAVFGLQSFIIIGGVIKLLPLTGITLPFISYGGSSLVANFLLAGCLLAISGSSGGERSLSLRLASNPNLAIRNVFLVLLAFFLAILATLSYWQLWAAEKLASRPENIRPLARELSIDRGRIITEDGAVLAESKRSGRIFRRMYPQGELSSHLIGFNSVRYGKSGLEKAFNAWLLGKQHSSFPKLLSAERFPGGDDLFLTINSRIQRKAQEALGSRRGSVVALNPQTGAILALVSFPTYDPNQIDQDWSSLSTAQDHPLLNRATQGLYPPGSTFKIMTLAAALDTHAVQAGDTFAGPQDLSVYGGKVTNYGKQDFPQLTVEQAFVHSVNTVFAQVGLKLGGTRLVSYAERFGLNSRPPLELEVKESRIPLPEAMDKLEVAWTSVGQGRAIVTPFQMALVGAAVANQGKIMRPYLVKEIRTRQGKLLQKENPRVWKTAVGPATSAEATRLMIEVVDSGTGKAASLPGTSVAGKTGTAETAGKKQTHAWFVGFAPAEHPRVAVAVIVEGGGTGGRVAAPIAREILQEALKE